MGIGKAEAERRLAKLGFEIDWTVSGPDPDGGWSGTIDASGRTSINGDCFGPAIHGDNASAWYANAIAEAKGHAGHLRPCINPDCDMHAEFPVSANQQNQTQD